MILGWEREQTSIQDRLKNEDKNLEKSKNMKNGDIVIEQVIPEYFIYFKKAI